LKKVNLYNRIIAALAVLLEPPDFGSTGGVSSIAVLRKKEAIAV
jgi:hypothetical protein